MTQAEFAAVAGVGQATVSRWETGVSPSLDEMRAIRNAARERGLTWDDSWFFDPPAADAPDAEEAAGRSGRPAGAPAGEARDAAREAKP